MDEIRVIDLERERSRRAAVGLARAYRSLAYRFPADSLHRVLVTWVSENLSREAADLARQSATVALGEAGAQSP